MTRCRIVTVAASALAVGAALPGVASATDYCVGAGGCDAANTYPTFEQAIAKAESQADSDRITLGAGQYKAQAITGFSYDRPDGPVEIIGAGRGQTVLTGLPGGSGNVLFLNGGDGTSIHDLTIRIPVNVATADYRGLTLKDAARRIEVVEVSPQAKSTTGVLLLDGGTLSDSTVALSDYGTIGVTMQRVGALAPPNVVRDSNISAVQGMWVDGGGRIERSYVTGEAPAVYVKNGLTEIKDSLLRTTSDSGTDVFLTCSVSNTTLRLEGDTLVGLGPASTTGVHVTTSHGPGYDINLSVRDSVLDADLPIGGLANGPGWIRLGAASSAYDPSENQLGGNTTAEQTDIVRGDPGFVDAPGGNFRLRPDSPLVDAGSAGAAQGLDLDGNPLVADGNGDGSARRDIGAFELQPAPAPQGDTQAPVVTAFHARRSRVSYRLSESARVVVKVQRRLAGKRGRYRTLGNVAKPAKQGTNRIKLSRRIRAKDARPGRYRAVIVATDPAGNRSATRAATFRVSR
jgi:hypothetical protein